MDLLYPQFFKLFPMTYILSYSSISKYKKRLPSQFGGSSRFYLVDGELIEKPSSRYNPDKIKVTINRYKNEREYISEIEEANIENINTDFIPKPSELQHKGYRLNKSKVRKRCFAFSRLKKSAKFFAFYTITFPVGLSDQNCYKFFNLWLTRCRKTGGLNSYLWVAERQKNKTIHFHLLTNDYMEIKEVNGYMAKALSNGQKKENEETLKSFEPEKYNGIDVKKVGNTREKLVGYLSKYITKNEIEFYRLPWHCSRDVSRLFTTVNFEEEDSDRYFDLLPESMDEYNIHYSEYLNTGGFKFIPDTKVFEDIDSANEVVYSNKSIL